jgi:hypothetical protein
MFYKRSLYLCSRQPVPRDVDDVVDASSDPVVALVVTASTVSGKLRLSVYFLQAPGLQTHIVAFVNIQICVHVPLVCSPNGAGHAGPWLLESQHTLYIITVYFFAGNGIDDCGLDAEEGEGRRSRLSWRNTTKWGNNVRPGLRLPISLSNC